MSPTNASVSDVKIEPFDGTNYSLWSFKMRMYLMSKGLWEIVTGTVEGTESKRQQAHAAIVLNLADSQLMHVINAQDAKEAWMMLENFHRTKDMASKLWLKEKFSSFKFTASSMAEHVAELERLIMEMRAVGCPPTEEDACATLIRSLPSSYESLVQAFRMSTGTFTMCDIVAKLIAEEVRQKDVTRLEEATAMMAKNKGKMKKGRYQKKNRSRGPCFKCGQMGHYAAKCNSAAKEEESSNVAFNVGERLDWSSEWVMDSGASAHMCQDRALFEEYQTERNGRVISAAKNGTKLRVLGSGTVNLEVWNGTKWINARLENALHVEDLSKNLFSLTAAMNRGMMVRLANDGCTIERNGVCVATGSKRGNLVYLNTKRLECHVADTSSNLWHRRLGHASVQTVNSLIRSGAIKSTELEDESIVCDVCATSKQSRASFNSSETELEKNNRRDDSMVCSDVLGPITPVSNSGYTYVVTFTLMKSRYVTIYPLRKKSEVTAAFIKFCVDMKKNCGIKVKLLRSDNGGEYKNKAMQAYCDQFSIKQEFTVAYNPQQNGMSERMNRTLVEMTRCMLNESGLEKKYWLEAMMTAVDIRNVLPNASNRHQSPFELVFNRKPSMEHMRVFGSKCFAHVPKEKRKKLDDTGVKCVFLGYAKAQKAYRLMRVDDGSIVISRSVVFAEYPERQQKQVTPVIDVIEDEPTLDDTDANMEAPTAEPPRTPPRETRVGVTSRTSSTPGRDGEDESDVRPARKRREVVRYEQEYPNTRRGEFNVEDFDGYESLHCFSAVANEDAPATVEEALNSQYREKWIEAMESEMKSLQEHNTWELVDEQKGKKAIGCKWVLRIKRNPDGTIARFKARLVAKGYDQRPGVDYTETYAPTARPESIRLAMAIAAAEEMEAENIDVDTAFLYGEMDEEVLMDQVPYFVDKTHPNKKCLLKKALYGTKQAARQWNNKMNAVLLQHGFERSKSDPCVYTRKKEDEYSILVLHVDDNMVFSKSKAKISEIKSQLKQHFKIKELGVLKYCLGIEVHRDWATKRIFINQEAYVKKLLAKFGLEQAKDVHTPMDPNAKLVKMPEDETFVPRYPYRELVGSLMYLMVWTRPDIAHAVGEVSKFCDRHNNTHWTAAKRILKYVKTTIDYGIVFDGQSKGELVGFADANWAADLDTRRSTTGYIFFVHSSAVSWRSQRQPTVAASSTEAEYMSLFSAAQEMVWLRQLMKDIKQSPSGPTTVFEDNQGCIALAKNPVYHTRTKHIDIKYHFVREKVASNEMQVEYKSTDEMIADALTKPLSTPKINQFTDSVGMKFIKRSKNVHIKGEC